MTDKYSKAKRSEIMSKIRSRGTGIELEMRRTLEAARLDFVYQPRMFGSPDFLVKPQIAVFCDGSFWHGRDWRRLRKKLKPGYWRNHIEQNRIRDRLVNRRLGRQGYTVLRFWDFQIERNPSHCIEAIEVVLTSNTPRNCE